MKHTQGEWKFNGRDIIVGQNIGQQRICTMIEHRAEYKAEDEANTRLIAAAPDLLDALKGDEENCVPNVPMILSQALLGNYEAVKAMLRELCSINAKAIVKAEQE